MGNYYNIKPVTLEFNGVTLATAVKLRIDIAYTVGNGGTFTYTLADAHGNAVHKVEQPIPTGTFGSYSDAAAVAYACNELGITLAD